MPLGVTNGPRLPDVRPDLMDEWHPEKNAGIDPHTLGTGHVAIGLVAVQEEPIT